MYQEFGRDGIEGGMLMGLNYLQIMNKTGCLSSNLAFWLPSEERLIYIPFEEYSNKIKPNSHEHIPREIQ